MKKNILTTCLLLTTIFNAFAQQAYYDTTFGVNGMVALTNINAPGLSTSQFGKIIKHGNSIYTIINNSSTTSTISKYDSNGIKDDNFGLGFSGYNFSIEDAFQGYLGVTSDDKMIMVNNSFAIYSTNPIEDPISYNICRFSLDGTVDTTYGTNGYAAFNNGQDGMFVLSTDMLQNDDLVITGYNNNVVFINKFDANGGLYTNIGNNGVLTYTFPAGIYPVQALYSESGDSVYVGALDLSNGYINSFITKLNLATGLPDPAFGTNGTLILINNEHFKRFTLDDADKLFVATVNDSESLLYKYNSDGTPNADFANGQAVHIDTNNLYMIRKIAYQDGKVIILSEIDYEAGLELYRFNNDGTVDADFGISGKIYRENTSDVLAFDFLQYDNYITVGGGYRYSNNVIYPALYKFLINPDLAATDLHTNDGLILYPNPASESINVKSDFLLEKAELYNIAGQLVLISHLDNNRVDINSLPKGCYIVKLYGIDGTQHTQKLIKR